MKIKYHLLFASILCSTVLGLSFTRAEEVPNSMKDAYRSFKQLQPYLSSSERFSDPRNSQTIKSNLDSLKKSFHKVDKIDSSYKAQPGFVTTLGLVTEMIDDASKRFSEDKRSYAFWRLRTLSNHCGTCHVTYNVKLTFKDKEAAPEALSDLEKAQFYLSTRQYAEANELLSKKVKSVPAGFERLDLLRHWLVVQVKVIEDPNQTKDTLVKFTSELQLLPSESEEVDAWIASLKSWGREGTKSKSVSEAERIVREAMSGDALYRTTDAVGLLRGTAMLHSLILDTSLSNSDRAHALYLLGLGYSELSLFLIDELPEMYLEQCIEEFGGTKDAKNAFKLYEEVVGMRFSGSGGKNIPSDVAVRVMELYKKAYGIPEFQGRV